MTKETVLRCGRQRAGTMMHSSRHSVSSKHTPTLRSVDPRRDPLAAPLVLPNRPKSSSQRRAQSATMIRCPSSDAHRPRRVTGQQRPIQQDRDRSRSPQRESPLRVSHCKGAHTQG